MTRIFDAHCAYILYQEIVQGLKLHPSHKSLTNNLIKKDPEKFEAIYQICQVDIQNSFSSSKFKDYVDNYCSRNGMVDANGSPFTNGDHTIGLMICLIDKHDYNRDMSPPTPCRHPLIVGHRVFDDYCRYKLYEEIADDPSKLELWRPIAVEAVQKQDFFKFKERLEAYCDQHNMICLCDKQCRLLAENLTGQVVSKRVPASDEPLLVGTRVFDDDCLIQLCREIASDNELYEKMRQLAIRVVVKKDFAELYAYMTDYCKRNGMVCTNQETYREIIELLRDRWSFDQKLKARKPANYPRLFIHHDFYLYSQLRIFQRIIQDQTLKDKCNRLYLSKKNVKGSSTAFLDFMEKYCRDNNLASPFIDNSDCAYFLKTINYTETLWSVNDWKLINIDGWSRLSLWWTRFRQNPNRTQKESPESPSSDADDDHYYLTSSNIIAKKYD